MHYLPEFLSLALIHFLAVIIPGPDFAITINQSVLLGRKSGIYTALGIGAGISVHVFYTVLGVSALMHTNADLMLATSMLGAFYIIYLASKLLQAEPCSSIELALNKAIISKQEFKKSFSIGFFTNASNPKATLFFLAIFTTVVSTETPVSVQTIYGIWMCAVNATWLVLVAIFFSNEKVRASFLKMGH
jgi:threonine/homoserine/homoserine lactone efflux protein